ncbi:MAG TPA: hypothetical protein VK821_11750 [Dehalococcoidia bacterium]|nr:hypothetical protein [Dehalococcoidia bacterium]
MEKAGAQFMKQLDEQRRRYVDVFLKSNRDLPDRMRTEGVSALLDAEDDVLSLAVGPVREAVSLTVDGELYLRMELETSKLISAELHYFSENLSNNTLPYRIMRDLIGMATPVELTVVPQAGADPKRDFDKNVRALAEA